MLRILQTFNDHSINDGTSYRGVILNPNALPAAQPVYIAHSNADSQDAGTYTVESYTIAIRIKIQNYANRIALIAQLKRWFKRGTLGDLVAMFTDDGLDYYKSARVVNLVQDPEYPMYFTALLSTGWSSWRAVDPDTYTWNLTGSGGSHTVSLSGDDETPLSVTFELSAQPSGGYLYQQLYQLINAPAPIPALGTGPWCITLDTAALISDNSNKCQINAGAGITNSATTIPYDTVTGTIPSVGSGYVDSEQIRWTGKTGTTSGNLTGVTRGQSGTTAATHADNAVIRVSKMQANGADLRVFIDGREVNRWLSGMNTSSTKIWILPTMSQGQTLTIRTALDSSSDYDYIYFAVTPNTVAAIAGMPQEGIIVHGTEWIKYRKPTLGLYRLELIERGLLGTTKQAHSVGDVFSFMEHVITVCYGNTGVVEPSTVNTRYDDTKPVFSLSSSSNTSWVYDATGIFYQTNWVPRTGDFKNDILVTQGPVSKRYAIKEDAASGDPAIGMKIGSFIRGHGWVSEYAQIAFSLYRSCGIDTSTVTGRTYRTHTTWPETAALQKSTDGINYLALWNETPGTPTTWTALASHSGVSHGGAPWMRFMFSGAFAAGAYAAASFEILTATINFVSANLPTGTLLSQKVSAQLDLTLENTTNDDSLEVVMPMLLGLPLEVDGEAKTVLYHSTNAHDAITPNDESRDIWIRLQTGSNDLTIAATVGTVGTLEALLSWYRRRF